MLDFRYHALSLAAVLLALTVGILVGVAIGDSNLVSSAKNGIVRDLRSEVDAAERQTARMRSELRRSETVGDGLYSLAVQGTLAGRQIGLVFLGAPSERVNSLVRDAVRQAGATLSTAVAVREPLRLSLLAARASGTRYTSLGSAESTPGLVREFGYRIAVELVDGGPLIDRERTALLSAFDGSFGGLSGVVIERSEPKGMSGSARATIAELDHGLIEGLSTLGVSVVGVELTHTSPSQVRWYSAQRIASVDDLDSLDGRAALDLSLAGAEGAFGVKSTAEALLPRLPPRTPAAGASTTAGGASTPAGGGSGAESAHRALTRSGGRTRSAKREGSAAAGR